VGPHEGLRQERRRRSHQDYPGAAKPCFSYSIWQGSPQNTHKYEAAFFLARTTKPKKGKSYDSFNQSSDQSHNQTKFTNEKEVA
jgi:hypothetical protein